MQGKVDLGVGVHLLGRNVDLTDGSRRLGKTDPIVSVDQGDDVCLQFVLFLSEVVWLNKRKKQFVTEGIV